MSEGQNAETQGAPNEQGDAPVQTPGGGGGDQQGTQQEGTQQTGANSEE